MEPNLTALQVADSIAFPQSRFCGCVARCGILRGECRVQSSFLTNTHRKNASISAITVLWTCCEVRHSSGKCRVQSSFLTNTHRKNASISEIAVLWTCCARPGTASHSNSGVMECRVLMQFCREHPLRKAYLNREPGAGGCWGCADLRGIWPPSGGLHQCPGPRAYWQSNHRSGVCADLLRQSTS
jgi:hypothetical protein